MIIQKKAVSLQQISKWYRTRMDVYTENEAIKELLETGQTKDRHYKRLPASAVKGLLKAYNIMRAATRIEDLFRYNGLNYERLADRGTESVRCDRKYRLMFTSSPKEGEIIITDIELLEITNHYDPL